MDSLDQADLFLVDGGDINMVDADTCDTPITTAAYNQEEVSPKIDTKQFPYRSLIGGLSHLARFTRADILYATFYFARFQNNLCLQTLVQACKQVNNTQMWLSHKCINTISKSSLPAVFLVLSKDVLTGKKKHNNFLAAFRSY